jgi:hypothetical protein
MILIIQQQASYGQTVWSSSELNRVQPRVFVAYSPCLGDLDGRGPEGRCPEALRPVSDHGLTGCSAGRSSPSSWDTRRARGVAAWAVRNTRPRSPDLGPVQQDVMRRPSGGASHRSTCACPTVHECPCPPNRLAPATMGAVRMGAAWRACTQLQTHVVTACARRPQAHEWSGPGDERSAGGRRLGPRHRGSAAGAAGSTAAHVWGRASAVHATQAPEQADAAMARMRWHPQPRSREEQRDRGVSQSAEPRGHAARHAEAPPTRAMVSTSALDPRCRLPSVLFQ